MTETKPGVVLITGAARRIGRTLALDFAAQGWAVAIHYGRSADEAHAVAAEVRAMGRGSVALPCDLADAEAVGQLIPQCVDRLGPPVCLVNNASEFSFDSIADMTPAGWDRHIAINLRAPVFLSQSLAQSVARHLPADSEGNIINIIDQRVWNLTPEFFSYTVSKAGLWSATRMLAQALAPRVRVNAIGPGPILRSIHQTAEDFAAEEASTLLRRGATPEQIADAIRFILNAPAFTGQMLALDGGQHLAFSHALSPASDLRHASGPSGDTSTG